MTAPYSRVPFNTKFPLDEKLHRSASQELIVCVSLLDYPTDTWYVKVSISGLLIKFQPLDNHDLYGPLRLGIRSFAKCMMYCFLPCMYMYYMVSRKPQCPMWINLCQIQSLKTIDMSTIQIHYTSLDGSDFQLVQKMRIQCVMMEQLEAYEIFRTTLIDAIRHLVEFRERSIIEKAKFEESEIEDCVSQTSRRRYSSENHIPFGRNIVATESTAENTQKSTSSLSRVQTTATTPRSQHNENMQFRTMRHDTESLIGSSGLSDTAVYKKKSFTTWTPTSPDTRNEDLRAKSSYETKTVCCQNRDFGKISSNSSRSDRPRGKDLIKRTWRQLGVSAEYILAETFDKEDIPQNIMMNME